MATPDEAAPCRLAVYLARAATAAVILRRGPSPWAQLTTWDRTNDTFQHGQWFHGRIYERRCDLSPDGELFVYVAAKHAPRTDDDDIGEVWTAISRPPYVTALALWRNLGSWYGGGVFMSERHVLLDLACERDAHPKFQPQGLTFALCHAESAPWEQRMLRDGWQLVERGFDPRTHRRVGKREIWQKPFGRSGINLYRRIDEINFARFGGPYGDTYRLEITDDLVPLSDVTWADWDDGRRLVFARHGRLFNATVEGTQLHEAELYDFNPLVPEEIVAPDWARRW